MHHITLLRGDGIGPEVIGATLLVLDALRVPIQWHDFKIGQDALNAGDALLPLAMLASLDHTGVCLKGPVTTPIAGGFASVNVALRKHFQLFANLRPVYNLPGISTPFQGVDLVIVRENTEGLYAGLEHEVAPGVVVSMKTATAPACTRIARFAFDYARTHRRRRVDTIHKANIIKLSDGLMLQCAREVAREFPAIQYGEKIVDNTAMQLVMRPQQFDVMLMENLYGDILSDLAAGLVGGLGLVAGANLGARHAVFEPVHGSAPDIAGQDTANPTAALMAAEQMLRHLGEIPAADRLKAAILAVYTSASRLTADLGGKAGTAAFAQAVIAALH